VDYAYCTWCVGLTHPPGSATVPGVCSISSHPLESATPSNSSGVETSGNACSSTASVWSPRRTDAQQATSPRASPDPAAAALPATRAVDRLRAAPASPAGVGPTAASLLLEPPLHASDVVVSICQYHDAKPAELPSQADRRCCGVSPGQSDAKLASRVGDRTGANCDAAAGLAADCVGPTSDCGSARPPAAEGRAPAPVDSVRPPAPRRLAGGDVDISAHMARFASPQKALRSALRPPAAAVAPLEECGRPGTPLADGQIADVAVECFSSCLRASGAPGRRLEQSADLGEERRGEADMLGSLVVVGRQMGGRSAWPEPAGDTAAPTLAGAALLRLKKRAACRHALSLSVRSLGSR
jgi:hypothetical protein